MSAVEELDLRRRNAEYLYTEELRKNERLTLLLRHAAAVLRNHHYTILPMAIEAEIGR